MTTKSQMSANRWNAGFTLVETVLVVAVVVILTAVAFVNVIQMRVTIRQKEMDETAKAIYFAAQNHLTAADDMGLVKNMDAIATARGAAITGNWDSGSATTTYFFGYNPTVPVSSVNNPVNSAGSVLGLMLPAGAIDEHVRMSGSYVIRYDYDSCRILDVYFSDSPSQFYVGEGADSEHPIEAGTVATLLNKYRGEEGKNARRSYNGVFGNVIGYFNGDDATGSDRSTVEPALVRVTNGDQLKVFVKDPNRLTLAEKGAVDYHVNLLIVGKSSGAQMWFDLNDSTAYPISLVENNDNDNNKEVVYEVVLDDVVKTKSDGTLDENGRFRNLSYYVGANEDVYKTDSIYQFTPGEDLQIYVESFYRKAVSNVARSIVYTTNSLFANGSKEKEDSSGKVFSARIASMRHLINLEGTMDVGSGLAGVKEDHTPYRYESIEATQLTDLSWSKFTHNTGYETSEEVEGATVYTPKPLTPVAPILKVDYDGQGKAISDVIVNTTTGDAGLFSTLQQSSEVKDLVLANFDITSANGSAGMLVGSIPKAATAAVKGVKLNNVLAYDGDKAGNKSTVTGATAAGGLVGKFEGEGSRDSSAITGCAAAVVVKATGANGVAGGLVGTVADATIADSYAGGHTTEGKFVVDAPNVSATGANGIAGGLVGSQSNTAVSTSYSTCSAQGHQAGGFVGTSTGSSIQNCYAMGLVTDNGESADTDDSTVSTLGAFAASFAGQKDSKGLEGNLYYAVINNTMQSVPNTVDGKPVAMEGVGKIDETAATYDAFYQGTATAYPYDEALITTYGGKYPYKTVKQLRDPVPDADADQGTHYGDWPSPETLVYNTKS